jgi:hypothetical protein
VLLEVEALRALHGVARHRVGANPITSVIDAARGSMLGGPVAEPLVDAVVWMAVIQAVFAPLAILRYRRRV